MTADTWGNRSRSLFQAAVACLMLASPARAGDRSVLVYPSSATVLRYDVDRYELVGPGDPNYQSNYAIAGNMLWDKVESRVPTEVYQAPALVGFEPSVGGQSEFVTLRNDFNLIIDGFNDTPRFLGNILVRFLPVPGNSTPLVEFDGIPVQSFTVSAGNLNVLTPTADGNYSDTLTYRVRWSGATKLRILVYSDKNLNGVFDDGPPLFSVVAEDNTVPVEEKTWGAVKALYR